MNKNYLDCRPPPIQDYNVPSKRQKMDIVNLPKLDPSTIEPVSEEEWSGLTRELLTVRRSLLQTEITSAQFRRLRVQMKEVIREEERNLERYLRMNRETTKQLEEALGTTVWSAHEVREAEAIAEAEMSQIKIRMREKLTNLLTENYQMNASSPQDTPIFPMIQSNESEVGREMREAEKNIKDELAYMLKGEWASQEFNSDKLQEARIKFQQLESQRASLEKKPILSSRIPHANALEGVIQSEIYVIPALRDAESNLLLKEQTVSIQERLKDGDRVEQQVMFLPGNADELPSSLQCYESREGGNYSATLVDEKPPPPSLEISPIQENLRADAEKPASLWFQPDTFLYSTEGHAAEALDLSLPCPRFNQHDENRRVEETYQDLRIMVGSYYVLASHPQYFQIDWEIYYKQDLNNKYICNKCLVLRNSRGKMRDHVWVKHFGGRFRCPLCPDARSMSTRDGVGVHIKRFHPNAFPPTTTNRATKTARSFWKL